MTLPELLREARRLAANLTFEAWDRHDYEARAYEVRESRETRIDVAGGPHEGSHEGIVVVMAGDQVKDVRPGSTVEFWQADPVMRAFRDGQNVPGLIPTTTHEKEPHP